MLSCRLFEFWANNLPSFTLNNLICWILFGLTDILETVDKYANKNIYLYHGWL